MKVYEPAEDSFLLALVVQKFLKNLTTQKKLKLNILDMGTGSGIQALNCIQNIIKPSQITSVDINKDALKRAKELNVNIISSNLFDKINTSIKFDLIIFNPPYLPAHKYDKFPDTTGGKNGDETIIRFINDLPNYLTKKSTCFLLTSSLTPNMTWQKLCTQKQLSFKLIATKSIFQEELYVWEIRLR